MSNFVGLDGYPCSFEESPLGQKLIRAVRRVPGASNFSDHSVETFALWLLVASDEGRRAELPQGRPASEHASFLEMKKLKSMAEGLVEHIYKIHMPAIQALQRQGIDLNNISNQLATMLESMSGAWGDLEPQPSTRGRPQKHEASDVTEEAATVFELVAGYAPTFTSDPISSEVTGAWPIF